MYKSKVSPLYHLLGCSNRTLTVKRQPLFSKTFPQKTNSMNTKTFKNHSFFLLKKMQRCSFNSLIYLPTLLLLATQLQAQWLTANGNMYVQPTVKIGIGTVTPGRSLEILNAVDSYLRVSSLGGNELDSYAAGVELKRSLFSGSTTTWALNNESTFKIRRNGIQLFSLGSTIAWLGQDNDNPLEFAIYGKSIDQIGSSIAHGALRLQSKVGNTLHVLRIDGNQLESNGELHLNHLSEDNITLAQGGGKVKVGTADNEARLSVASETDMQLKLINPGNQGAAWRIGVANSNWAAGAGKLVFSNTSSSEDATMVITPAGKVGIGLTTPSKTLHVNGTTSTKVLEITGGADFAEQFDITSGAEVLPGTVVSIDPEKGGKLRVSQGAYDKTVAGIVSGAGDVQPGMLMSQAGTLANGQHPVALSGRVYCQVDARYGAVRPGDLLTTSATAGHAMKVTDAQQAQGAIIGKAMTSLENGTGLVLVLVSLQ
jgi:hypothetical protein